MTLEHITTHVDEGLALITERYRKPRIKALLASVLARVQAVEDSYYDLLSKRSPETAEGAVLDLLGKLVAQAREGRSDALYRLWIAAKVLVNSSYGTTQDIIATTKKLVGIDTAAWLEDQYPAAFMEHVDAPIDADAGVEIAKLLELAKAAGVAMQFHWFRKASTFAFLDSIAIDWSAAGTGIANSTIGAYGAGIYCIGGWNRDTIATSPDGVTWTEGALAGVPSDARYYGLVYTGGLFFALAWSPATMVTSPDGVTWTAHTLTSDTLRGVCWNGRVFCAVADSNGILTSPDAITWTSRACSTADNVTHFIEWSGSFDGVASSAAGTLIAVGAYGEIQRSTDDGLTWAWIRDVSNNDNSLYDVAWGNGKFMAVGTGSAALYVSSDDGLHWAPVAISEYPDLALYEIKYVEALGIFIAVGSASGSQGAVLTSPDGLNWAIDAELASTSALLWIAQSPRPLIGNFAGDLFRGDIADADDTVHSFRYGELSAVSDGRDMDFLVPNELVDIFGANLREYWLASSGVELDGADVTTWAGGLQGIRLTAVPEAEYDGYDDGPPFAVPTFVASSSAFGDKPIVHFPSRRALRTSRSAMVQEGERIFLAAVLRVASPPAEGETVLLMEAYASSSGTIGQPLGWMSRFYPVGFDASYNGALEHEDSDLSEFTVSDPVMGPADVARRYMLYANASTALMKIDDHTVTETDSDPWHEPAHADMEWLKVGGKAVEIALLVVAADVTEQQIAEFEQFTTAYTGGG